MAVARSFSGGVTQTQGEGAISGIFFFIDNALCGPYSYEGSIRLKITYLK